MHAHFDWEASPYFRKLTDTNRLARSLGMTFGNVSGLQGFEDALAQMQESRGFVCLAESSDGVASLDVSPNARRVKTVFLALRHEESDMKARDRCLALMREVFRQFLSHLIREKNRLHVQGIYLDPEIRFHEMEQYFASGCACAYFQIGISTSIDLRYNAGEWTE